MPAFFHRINWVDLFVIILSARIYYIAFKKGISAELFKLLGTGSGLYLAMHFYAVWGAVAYERMGLQALPLSYLECVSFGILAFLGYLVFVFARYAASKLIHAETMQVLDRWGGLTLGVIRSIILSSMLVFMFVVSAVDYMTVSVAKSVVGRQVFYCAPSMYSSVWGGLFSKISPGEQYNKKVDQVKGSLTQ